MDTNNNASTDNVESVEGQNIQQDEQKLSSSYNFFTLPVISSFFFFWQIFKGILITFGVFAEQDKKQRSYVKDANHNVHLSSSSKASNLFTLAFIIGISVITYSGLEACLKVFKYFSDSYLFLLTPLCFTAFCALFTSNSFNNYYTNSKNFIKYSILFWIVGALLAIAATFYLESIEVFQVGKAEGQHSIAAWFFIPIFILTGYILPFTFSGLTLFLTLKDKSNSKKTITTLLAAFLISSSYYAYIGFNRYQVNTEIQQEQLAKIEKEKEKQRQIKLSKQRQAERNAKYAAERAKYTVFSPKVMSAMYLPDDDAKEYDSRLANTNTAAVFIHPNIRDQITVKLEGIEKYEYGMIIPTGTYNLEIISYHSNFKSYKEIIRITEGGFVFYPKLESKH